MELRNKKLENKVFEDIRNEVIKQWPTGSEVNFDEAVEYHKKIPKKKVFASRMEKAKRSGETLIQPRAGVALVDEQVKLLRFLEEDGEADLLPTTIDSYTRHNRYEEAQKGIEESLTADHSVLNGFPAVNHGVRNCRYQ